MCEHHAGEGELKQDRPISTRARITSTRATDDGMIGNFLSPTDTVGAQTRSTRFSIDGGSAEDGGLVDWGASAGRSVEAADDSSDSAAVPAFATALKTRPLLASFRLRPGLTAGVHPLYLVGPEEPD